MAGSLLVTAHTAENAVVLFATACPRSGVTHPKVRAALAIVALWLPLVQARGRIWAIGDADTDRQ